MKKDIPRESRQARLDHVVISLPCRSCCFFPCFRRHGLLLTRLAVVLVCDDDVMAVRRHRGSCSCNLNNHLVEKKNEKRHTSRVEMGASRPCRHFSPLPLLLFLPLLLVREVAIRVLVKKNIWGLEDLEPLFVVQVSEYGSCR
jgi:hypothetical protein